MEVVKKTTRKLHKAFIIDLGDLSSCGRFSFHAIKEAKSTQRVSVSGEYSVFSSGRQNMLFWDAVYTSIKTTATYLNAIID